MEALREKIIAVASEMFFQYGIRSVSIDDVCKQLSISKKTFYLYFKQKEDLVDAFITTYETKKEEELRQTIKNHNGNAIDDLLIFLRFSKDFASLNKRCPALFFDLEKYYQSVLEKHYRLREEKISKAFTINLQKGIKEGFYRENLDTDMLGLFFGFHQRALVFEKLKHILKAKNLSQESFTHFFIELLARYAMTPKGWKYLLTQTKCTECTDKNNNPYLLEQKDN